MRAAVCRELGRPLSVEEVELAAPAAGEIAVRIAACAVCHSDLSFIDGDWGGSLPAVYGHEASGIVEEVGAGVDTVTAGDHVVLTLVRWCGTCGSCARGEPALCEATFALDRRSPLRGRDGVEIQQRLRVGAFAERAVVHASQAVSISREVGLEAAALLGCAVLTGYGAVVNTAAVEAGSSVVVIGAGGVGLNVVQAAALAGAEPIVALDPVAAKLPAARSFGATAAAESPDAIGGRDADYVFVATGAPEAAELGLSLLRRGGTLVLLGMPASGVTARIDPGAIAHDGQRIVGSKLGSTRPHVDIPRLVQLYLERRLKLDELVTARYPLARIDDAIAAAASGETLRNVVTMEAAA